MMKKLILVFSLLLVAVVGFSQINKADAAGFISRNLASATKISLYNTVGLSSDRIIRSSLDYAKGDIVSLTALESGFSLIVKQESGNKEKFYPYASILYLFLSGDNDFIIVFKD